MKEWRRVVAAVGVVLGAGASPGAHHAVNATYDMNSTRDMEGVLRKVDWVNPHAFLHFDVKMPDGTVQLLRLEGPPPAGWRRAGVAAKGALQVGATYKFEMWPARNGDPEGLMSVLFLPDGRKVSLLGAQNFGRN